MVLFCLFCFNQALEDPQNTTGMPHAIQKQHIVQAVNEHHTACLVQYEMKNEMYIMNLAYMVLFDILASLKHKAKLSIDESAKLVCSIKTLCRSHKVQWLLLSVPMRIFRENVCIF